MNRLRGNGSAGRRTGRRRGGGGRPKEPVDPETLIDEAWDYCEAGAFDKAFGKLEEIGPSGRRGKDYLLMMTLVCGELKKDRRMLAVARQLVEADPTVDFHWGFLGEAARRRGGVCAAVRIWHEALRRNPGLASVRWRLAAHYCIMNRLRPAREQLKIALHLDPHLIAPTLDEPVFGPIWETAAEAGSPPPEEGEEWKESDSSLL
jgi:tetratricopeptide (TPR) repeat protein